LIIDAGLFMTFFLTPELKNFTLHCNAEEISPVINIGMSKFNEKETRLIQAAKRLTLALVNIESYSFYECLDRVVALVPLKPAFRYIQEGYLLARRSPTLSEAQRMLMDDEWFVKKATVASYFRSARQRHDDSVQHQAA
jgi:hypothetical protein